MERTKEYEFIMRTFTGLYLFLLVLCFLGCDETGSVLDVVDDVIFEPVDTEPVGVAEPPETTSFGKHSVEFWTQDALEELIWGFEKRAGDTRIHYSYEPNTGGGWDTGEWILIGRPTVLVIPIWILDPERNCMLLREKTEVDGFIEPYQVEIFNWDTKEPYRFHQPRWEGQPPEPIIRKFQHKHTNKDICPRKWFYFARLPIYLKYVEGDDKTSKQVGITAEEIGITIEFENGEKLTWNLSEIYPEIPPMPPFKLADQ